MSRRSATDAALAADDLSVARGGSPTRIVEGVSFRVAPGATLAIMGPTGAGKSTLAQLLAGDDTAGVSVVGGSGSVAGIPLTRRGRGLRTRQFLTGHLAQDAGTTLPARSTVGEVIAAPVTSRDRRVNARALEVRVASLLDEFQLPLGVVGKYPYELSSGMRQRVAFARALMLDPPVFVGDEPFANLDIDVRRAARDALLRRQRESDMAVLVVSNDADVIRDLDADVLVLRSGHPVGFGHGVDDVLWTPGGESRLGG